jgi:hypothetical protein
MTTSRYLVLAFEHPPGPRCGMNVVITVVDADALARLSDDDLSGAWLVELP